MSVRSNLDSIEKYLINLEKEGDYDVEKYSYSLLYQTSQIAYFFCHLAKDKSSKETFYRVKNKPKENEVAYFNIGRGFPKELYDGHWSYVVKDLGYKLLIIPCTSIKEDSPSINPEFEKELITTNGKETFKCRLQLSDLRVVDLQRLDERKPVFKVLTNSKEIKTFIKEKLFE